MKKLLAITLAMLFGLVLFAGCGAKDPVDPGSTGSTGDTGEPDPVTIEPLQYEYFSFLPVGDWFFYEKVSGVKMKIGDVDSNVEMTITDYTSQDSQAVVERRLNSFKDAVQGENVTFNGIEYFVVDDSAKVNGDIFLLSNRSEDDLCGLEIVLHGATIEQAAPLLETLKINDAEIEIVHEWPESEAVETKYVTYTVQGGWYLYNKFDQPYANATPEQMRNDAFGDFGAELWISYSPGTMTDNLDVFSSFLEVEPLNDNVTINGIEYLQFANEDGLTVLATTNGPALDMDKYGIIEIRIEDCSVADAMPVLETIVIKAN